MFSLKNMKKYLELSSLPPLIWSSDTYGRFFRLQKICASDYSEGNNLFEERVDGDSTKSGECNIIIEFCMFCESMWLLFC